MKDGRAEEWEGDGRRGKEGKNSYYLIQAANNGSESLGLTLTTGT